MESLDFGSIEPDEAMVALESFVDSEMNQRVLVKRPGPRKIHEIDQGRCSDVHGRIG